jgi:hypothetical protein
MKEEGSFAARSVKWGNNGRFGAYPQIKWRHFGNCLSVTVTPSIFLMDGGGGVNPSSERYSNNKLLAVVHETVKKSPGPPDRTLPASPNF